MKLCAVSDSLRNPKGGHVTLRIIWHSFCAIFGKKATFRGAFIIAFASFQPRQLGGERRGISWAVR
jgi:hypothetical protein